MEKHVCGGNVIGSLLQALAELVRGHFEVMRFTPRAAARAEAGSQTPTQVSVVEEGKGMA